MVRLNNIVGLPVHHSAEVIVLFKVDGKYFPSTQSNRESFETFLHTGDDAYLGGLEHEMEF